MEMSFADDRDIQKVIEQALANIWKNVYGKELKVPFQRISFYDAMHRYGSDAPDMRYGLELHDVTEIVKNSSYEIFKRIISREGKVECVNVKASLISAGPSDESGVCRSDVDRLIEWAKGQGMGGLTWMRMTTDGLSSNIVKYFPKETTTAIEQTMGAEEGDLLLFLAGSEIAALKAGGELRRKLAKDLHLLEGKDHQFIWLVDCPLFQHDALTGQIVSFHHPFVMPVGGDIDPKGDTMSIKGLSFDLVMDGSEIGSGSMRCHDPAIQRKIFKVLGWSDEKIQKDFDYFLEALSFGAPPHGGIALGMDRLVAIMLGCETIREVIAFPKNKKFQCPMDSCPAAVEDAKLAELQILSLAGDEDQDKKKVS